MTLLEIRDVHFAYGEVKVLHGVDLHVNQGEIVALLGANGAGKTTLINAVSGVNTPSSGDILFQGSSLKKVEAHQRPNLGLIQVPENRHLFGYLSVEANLRVGAYPKSARAGEADSLARIYDLLPVLKEKRNDRASSLSGGQQQMVAVGRALMAQPKLLMLDEPSLGLAPIIVQQLFELFEEIVETEKLSMLLVEQNVSGALKLAQRAYGMQEGQVWIEGEAGQIQNDPQFEDVMLGMAIEHE